ncbi:MAG: M20/M25/M40 family metallo-hydrolase [Pseudonocardia sp.]
MKLVLFDLGNTLESGDVLLPGALETLDAVVAMRDGAAPAALLGLVSDFTMASEPSEIPGIQQQYYVILDLLGIRGFVEPVEERVTLSTEVGVFKPDEAVFRAAVAKVSPGLTFADTMFITENRSHVLAARHLGLTAVHVRGPGQPTGDVEKLTDLIPIIRDFAMPAHEAVAVLRVTPDTAASLADTVAAAGADWTRVGDALVVTGSPEAVGRVAEQVADTAALIGRTSAPPGHVQLVLQNGRLFEQEHPDVPVIAGRGRHLVVALDPAATQTVHLEHLPCYAVRPLPRNATVVAERPPVGARRARPAWIRECVDRLSRATFEADLRALTAFPTRHSTSTHFLTAAHWASDRLVAMGYTTSTEIVAVGGGTSRNVIAERTGAGKAPRDVVVVTAHLDSVNTAGGATAPAPGADDNGSGSAGVLAIAAALAEHPGSLDLRLILFGGEEQGLFGSLQYVQRLSDGERGRIRAVVNMDMIGTLNTPTPAVLLEGATGSQHVIDALAEAAEEFTSLVVQTSRTPFNSDHVPFLQAGVPAVLTIEGADGANANVHSAADTLDTIDDDLPLEILRMNLGFTAELLGRA